MMIRLLCFLMLMVSLAGCSGCSKSRQKRKLARSSESVSPSRDGTDPSKNESLPEETDGEPEKAGEWSGVTTVKMTKESGVYKVPVRVNGVQMDFIFDTGASLISMSTTEATFLYKQGTLTDNDFVGTIDFTDANGDVSPGTVVKLRSVQIGNRILKNVEASIVNNTQAPLLLGQSALTQFGKISIDYKKGILQFE